MNSFEATQTNIPWYFTEPYDSNTIDLYSSIAGRASLSRQQKASKEGIGEEGLSESQKSKVAWRRLNKNNNSNSNNMSLGSGGQVEPEFYERRVRFKKSNQIACSNAFIALDVERFYSCMLENLT